MENQLKIKNILNAYSDFKTNRLRLRPITVGQYLGYLEAGLQSFGYLETFKNEDGILEVTKNTIRNNSWWRKDRKETHEQAIIRMVEKLFTDNKIKF
jgi:Asp-tRNA(Asn)/Glu-tRNA(Gln) amidotransferase C subunit